MSAQPKNVTVIGAGIVGMCCATYLQRDGYKVTVIDSVAPGESCSRGNAGGLSPGSIVPVAMPGILSQVPKWLRDPLGPLVIRWGYLLPVLPWLARFVHAGRVERVEQVATALRSLLSPVFDSYDPIVKAAGAQGLIHKVGQLHIYRTEAAFHGDAYGWKLRRDRGCEIEEVDAHQIRQIEPTLAPIFARGIHFPTHGHCANPFRLVQMLAEQFVRSGGTILRRRVQGFRPDARGPTALITEEGDVPIDRLVIAAGAWSHQLAGELGSPVPLETQRGYHVTVSDPGVAPRLNVMWADAKFMATPMELGVRFAGTVELAGLKAEPNYQRAQVLLERGKMMYPGLKDAKVSEWMGHRPCTPDTIPVISQSPHWPQVFYAFGHGHTGLSGASTTGRVIADLVGGRKPLIDVSPFRVDRF
ncbi:MAG: FAD-dependent oxidoreductase [Alphaproteobacteria bacterium]|nr:FAD-dependent oxidoreductase [Alphaproteobacteria bacterium]